MTQMMVILETTVTVMGSGINTVHKISVPTPHSPYMVSRREATISDTVDVVISSIHFSPMVEPIIYSRRLVSIPKSTIWDMTDTQMTPPRILCV